MLKSLEQFNREQAELYRRLDETHPNGIACPECGSQLWDSNPSVLVLTKPPRVHIHCPACGFSGSRVAGVRLPAEREPS